MCFICTYVILLFINSIITQEIVIVVVTEVMPIKGPIRIKQVRVVDINIRQQVHKSHHMMHVLLKLPYIYRYIAFHYNNFICVCIFIYVPNISLMQYFFYL